MFSHHTVMKHQPLKYLALFILLSLLGSGVLSGGVQGKSVLAARTVSDIRIDGVPDENSWSLTQPVSDFVQYDPEEGAAPSESTSVRVLYDDNALYVAVICYDSQPDMVTGQLSRRDRSTQADKFSVFIDSYHDHRTAFLFTGSVSGVQSDALLSLDGTSYDIQWDAVWSFNAVRRNDGWSAEFRIPFSALRFSGEDSGSCTWGINFRRSIARKKEVDDWVLVPRAETPPSSVMLVSRFGHLTGLNRIHPPLHIELLPYGVAKASDLALTDHKRSTELNGGMDVKYGMTNNLTLDLAINPDFGQVEVDQSVLNLTVFKTFYPEKRPFFLEGSPAFLFGNGFDNRPLYLFYSRQIGRSPSSVSADPGYMITESPLSTRILAAGKLSGITGDGLTVGILSAVTGHATGTEQRIGAPGDSRDLTFAPGAGYQVIRLKKDILENSSVGIMAGGEFRDGNGPVINGGADWNLRLGGGDYAVDGYVAGSQDYVGPQRYTGSAGKLGFGKLTGEHLLAFTSYDYSSADFRVDELGFYSQPREQGGYTQLSYRELHAPDPIRRYVLTCGSDYRWNWDGANTVKDIELEPQIEFRNFWTLTLDYYHDFPAYDDFNRGIYADVWAGIHGLYHRPSQNRMYLSLATDTRQSFSLALTSSYLSNTRQFGSVSTSLQMTIRPTTWIEFNPGVSFLRSRNEERWVQSQVTGGPIFTGGGQNLFADLDLDEYDLSFRGIVTFTREISVQWFAQLLLPTGTYEHYRVLTGPDTFSPPYSYAGSTLGQVFGAPDFSQQWLNANVVFRWEYLPGSTVYLVWTQARFAGSGTVERRFPQNFRNAFSTPLDNVFLAKISYWWSI